jgi:short-subunit dehydrogenase
MSTTLILGAGSDIALATANALAERGHDLVLAGRDTEALGREAENLALSHGVHARAVAFDALDGNGHGAFWDGLEPQPDGVVCAIGHLGDESRAQAEPEEARRTLETNFNGVVAILDEAARRFAAAGSGFIIALSSVAGDRGRASNYHYGAAKAGLTTYLSGLRNRFATEGPHGVRVITVKPGFVATRMTAGMELPARLTATPQQAARDIVRALEGRRDVVYTRWFWRWIMAIITHLPEPLFKRTRL